jgi:hypothetical protein
MEEEKSKVGEDGRRNYSMDGRGKERIEEDERRCTCNINGEDIR